MSYFIFPVLAVLSSSFLPSSSTCSECKTIQDCSSGYGSYNGSYNLVEENSPFCPELDGFSGCLYLKNGSSQTFCFKSGQIGKCHSYNKDACTSMGSEGITDTDQDHKPTTVIDNYSASEEPEMDDDEKPTTPIDNDSLPEEPDIDDDPKPIIEDSEIINIKEAVTVRPCLSQMFPNLADKSESETAGLCCDESDCQDQAGCFFDELTFNTYCRCYLGYYLDNSTASLPRTGECHSMRTQDCSASSPTTCYESEEYKLCPYCHMSDKTGSQDLIIGQYDSGEGTFDSDPMVFIGSSSECQEEHTSMFWYCWYDTMQEWVDPSQAYILVEDQEACEHWAYIYTPLACPFAQDV